MSESSRFFRVRSQCPWGGRSGREPSWGGKLSTVCAGHPGGLSVQLCPPDSNSQSWQDPCPGGVPGASYPRPRISSSPVVSAQQTGSHRSLALGKTATVAEGKRSAPLGSHICRVPSFKIKQKLFKGRRGGKPTHIHIHDRFSVGFCNLEQRGRPSRKLSDTNCREHCAVSLRPQRSPEGPGTSGTPPPPQERGRISIMTPLIEGH